MTDANQKVPLARRGSWVAKVDIAVHVAFLILVAICLLIWFITGQR